MILFVYFVSLSSSLMCIHFILLCFCSLLLLLIICAVLRKFIMNSPNRYHHSGPQSAKTVRINAEATKTIPRKRATTGNIFEFSYKNLSYPNYFAAPKFEYHPSKLMLEQNLTCKQNKFAQLKKTLDDAKSKYDAHCKQLNAYQNQLRRKGLTDKLIVLTPANGKMF